MGLSQNTLNVIWRFTMNILKVASRESGKHIFDIILESIENEVDDDVSHFISPQAVLSYCRNGGDELPTDKLPQFVVRHCYKVIDKHRQPALL